MVDIIKTSTSLREQQELKNFFDTSVNSLIKLHPHAGKKILSQLGISLQMEGCMRTARYKDAINVGEVIEDSEKTQRVAGKNITKVYTQKKMKPQAISPSGLPLAAEIDTRRKIIEERNKYLEEYEEFNRPTKNQ